MNFANIENQYVPSPDEYFEVALKKAVYLSEKESKKYFHIGFCLVLLGILLFLLMLISSMLKWDLAKSNYHVVASVAVISALLSLCAKSFFHLPLRNVAIVTRGMNVRIVSNPEVHWRIPFFEKVELLYVGSQIVDILLTPLTESEYAHKDILSLKGHIQDAVLYANSSKNPEEGLEYEAKLAVKVFRQKVLAYYDKANNEEICLDTAQKNFEVTLQNILNTKVGYKLETYTVRFLKYDFTGDLLKKNG